MGKVKVLSVVSVLILCGAAFWPKSRVNSALIRRDGMNKMTNAITANTQLGKRTDQKTTWGEMNVNAPMILVRTSILFVLTACAEILGCYLPYLWLKEGKSVWLVVPGAGSLAVFAWLLTLHPGAAARTYAAYG